MSSENFMKMKVMAISLFHCKITIILIFMKFSGDIEKLHSLSCIDIVLLYRPNECLLFENIIGDRLESSHSVAANHHANMSV